MTDKQRVKLLQQYKRFQKTKRTKETILSRFRTNMAEIIFRTTKLEGEPVTRKIVRALF